MRSRRRNFRWRRQRSPGECRAACREPDAVPSCFHGLRPSSREVHLSRKARSRNTPVPTMTRPRKPSRERNPLPTTVQRPRAKPRNEMPVRFAATGLTSPTTWHYHRLLVFSTVIRIFPGSGSPALSVGPRSIAGTRGTSARGGGRQSERTGTPAPHHDARRQLPLERASLKGRNRERPLVFPMLRGVRDVV